MRRGLLLQARADSAVGIRSVKKDNLNQGGTEIKDGLESESQQDRRRKYAWVEETRDEASNMGVKQ
jgi:hypothetical protein